MTTETKPASWLVNEMLAEQQRIKRSADQAKASAQAETRRIKDKMPLPPASSEGMFEVRFVQALCEVMTGKPTTAKPDLIKMPETLYEPIVLVLSSTGQFYYRVTPQGCTCKGFAYIGICRHFKAAFPELVAQRENRNCSERRPEDRSMKAPFKKSKSSRKRPEFIQTLTNSKRGKEYKEYLQNDYAAHRVHGFQPMDFKAFCKSARRLEKIQDRLKSLEDAGQWDCKEYKGLEREEHRYCVSLGY